MGLFHHIFFQFLYSGEFCTVGEEEKREEKKRGSFYSEGSQEAGRKRQASGTFWKALGPPSPQWDWGCAVVLEACGRSPRLGGGR